jgi:RHS repeat-associated protein
VPSAKLTKDGNFSIITDYLGTPVEAYNAVGERVWSAEFDIYGHIKEQTGEADFIPFRYQGQYHDLSSGLYYNRFRYYDPETGIYTQQDPIGLAGNNPTLYGYVRNTLIEVDIFGLRGDYYQIPKIPGFQKHHIIPQTMDHPLLNRLRFDVHQSRNIIQLPTSSSIDPTRTVHLGRHNSAYDRMIRGQLDAVEALKASDNIKRMHVNDIMNNTGNDLRNNRITLNCKS